MRPATWIRPLPMLLLLLASLLIPAGSGAADDVSAARTPALAGTVTDADGKPVEACEVIVLELKREARTDAPGTYEFGDLPAGQYTVVFQVPGYLPITRHVTVPATSPLDISLVRSVLTLPQVEVTATRVPRPTLDSPLSISFLGEAELERETNISLAHALEHLPGVRTVSTGGQIGKPMIRGLTGARVLTLDNGHRMEDYSWSDEDGPSIDPESGERIEVIRGPASVMYGSDAISGVVNVLPPEIPEAEEGEEGFVRGEVAGYYGSNAHEGGVALGAQGASGDMGWQIHAIGRASEAIHTPDGELENTGFSAITGDAAIGIHGTKGNASVRYARYGGEFKLLEAGGPPPGVEEGEEEGPERKAADNRVQLNGDLVSGTTRFEGKFQWQSHSLIELSDEAPLPDGKALSSRRGTEEMILAPAAVAAKEAEAFNLLLTTSSLDLLAHHKLGSKVRGTAGLTGYLQSNDTRGPIPLVPDATTNSGAAFLFEEARLGKWSLLGGVRGDARSLSADANPALGLAMDEDRDWTEFSGDAGIVFRPVPDLAFAANVGRSFRAPNLFELFANGPQIAEERYLRGDPDLGAERGLNLDGGIRWQCPRVHGEVAVFRNDISDFIGLYPTGETVGDLPVYEYRATDGVLTGAEVGVDVLVGGPLSVNGEFDMVRGEDDQTGDPLPLIPPVRGIVGAKGSWSDLGWARRFSAGVCVDIVGEKTRLVENEIGSDSYVLVGGDIDLVERVGGHDLDFSVRVTNAANTTYRDFLSRYKAFADNAGRDITVRVGTTF